MPNQTIASDADGLWYETNVWNATGDGGNLYVSDYPEGAGFSFTVDTEVPSGSTIDAAFLSVITTGGNQNGTITIGINVHDSDPATVAAWSTSPNPDTATPVASSPHSTGSFAPAISTNYFGSGETQQTSITGSIQDLVNSYGTLAVGDRINVWLEQTAGTGLFTVDDENAANELYIEWTAGGAAANPKGPLGMPLHGPFAGPVGP